MTERVDWLIHHARIASVRIAANGTEKSYLLHTKAEREVASDQIRGYLKTLSPKQRKCVVAQLAQQIDAHRKVSKLGAKIAQLTLKNGTPF